MPKEAELVSILLAHIDRDRGDRDHPEHRSPQTTDAHLGFGYVVLASAADVGRVVAFLNGRWEDGKAIVAEKLKV